MARQRDSKIVGTFGNLIFYNHNGDYRMRTKPSQVRRTEASVKSGFNFGKASTLSMQIRHQVYNIYPHRKGDKGAFHFTAALNKLISWKEKGKATSGYLSGGLPFLDGYQFSNQADLTSIPAIRVHLKKENTGSIQCSFESLVPSQSLQAPSNSKSIHFKTMLIGASLTEARTELSGSAEIEIPYTSETFQPPAISFPAFKETPEIIMLAMAVQYKIIQGGSVVTLSNQKKLPCGIAWAAQNN